MFTRRLFLALALATGLAAPAAAQAFPVTVEHIYGTTTIPAQPLRVVSVGMHEQDFLYALGIAPVGVKEWWGEHPYATWPWAEAARQAVGAEPEVMDTSGVNLEWVLAHIDAKYQRVRYTGRPAAASPATGLMSKHLQQLAAFLEDALGS